MASASRLCPTDPPQKRGTRRRWRAVRGGACSDRGAGGCRRRLGAVDLQERRDFVARAHDECDVHEG
eukprot:5335207-Pyramimonas_sp.AAC.1